MTGALWGQVVESPTTVAPGDWLLEADIVAGTWDYGRTNGLRVSSREFSAAPVLISTGISADWDVQFAFDGWVESKEQIGGLSETVSGWGDAWLRAKWNFVGDEETEPAWAILPYVKLPLADSDIGNGKFEGGMALVYGQPLGKDHWMEAFISGDTLHSEVGGRDEQLVGGVVWGRNLSEDTTIYSELLAEWITADHDEVPVIWGLGISPVLAEGFTLDFELLVGVTREAPDWGAAVRLVWEL
ncbi:transporter [Opitutaceae bacterium]|nr:transporter [bacterium]MDB4385013.1 transporter [Opitutaceae bacterium]